MIAARLGPEARNGADAVWRDGYRAAMTRAQTCLLAGDLDRLSFEVDAALVEKRGRPRRAPTPDKEIPDA